MKCPLCDYRHRSKREVVFHLGTHLSAAAWNRYYEIRTARRAALPDKRKETFDLYIQAALEAYHDDLNGVTE